MKMQKNAMFHLNCTKCAVPLKKDNANSGVLARRPFHTETIGYSISIGDF
jgi:hypothetical protein